jgi:TonB family protein
MKIKTLLSNLLCIGFCLLQYAAFTQDTLYYDKNYEPTGSRILAHYMEIKKCAADNEDKCSIVVFSLDSNRILFNWRYSDYENGILHGRCSRWYLSGGLHEEITFEQGKKNSLEKSFYRNGTLKKELLWELDSLKKGVFFNEDGTPKTALFKEDLDEYDEQEEPSFPGGLRAMYIYLSRNVEYPEEAKENGWSGQVVLTFVVGKDGKISDVNVVQSPQPVLAKAVVYVVNKMPRWTPGRVSGIPVRVRYTMPFKFKLE